MEDDRSRIEKIKQHLKDNKTAYFAAAGGAVVGGSVAGIFMLRYTGFQVPEIQTTAKNTALIVWKSPPTAITLVKQACPDPIPVLDKTTGEAYRSLRRAVEATGETLAAISKDAQGEQIRWERLPESVFA